MDQNAVIFDKLTQGLGGRLDIENLPDNSLYLNIKKDALNLLENTRNKNSNIPPIHIDFINNSQLNACAFIYNGTYFIGINAGTVNFVRIFYNYILSSPDNFLSIGNPFMESKLPKLDSSKLKDFNYLNLFNGIGYDISPKDDLRSYYSFQLFFFSIRFIIIHEIGHIVNGHVGYRSHTNHPFIFEIANHDKNFSNLNSQTMEMDADCYATANGINDLIIRVKKSINQIDKSPLDFTNQEDAFYCWMFSTYMVFRLFGEFKYEKNKLLEYSHPHPGMRQHIILATIHTIVQRTEYKSLLEKIPDIALKVVIDCEKILETVFNGLIETVPIKFAYQNMIHIYEIQNNWKNLRPLLVPFSHINLAPVVELDKELFKNKLPPT